MPVLLPLPFAQPPPLIPPLHLVALPPLRVVSPPLAPDLHHLPPAPDLRIPVAPTSHTLTWSLGPNHPSISFPEFSNTLRTVLSQRLADNEASVPTETAPRIGSSAFPPRYAPAPTSRPRAPSLSNGQPATPEQHSFFPFLPRSPYVSQCFYRTSRYARGPISTGAPLLGPGRRDPVRIPARIRRSLRRRWVDAETESGDHLTLRTPFLTKSLDDCNDIALRIGATFGPSSKGSIPTSLRVPDARVRVVVELSVKYRIRDESDVLKITGTSSPSPSLSSRTISSLTTTSMQNSSRAST